jgi:hypothetical protein
MVANNALNNPDLGEALVDTTAAEGARAPPKEVVAVAAPEQDQGKFCAARLCRGRRQVVDRLGSSSFET